MPRKSLKERKQKEVTDTDENQNRIRSVINNLVGNEDPDDIMVELMQALKESSNKIPNIGKYYIFVYNPKTPHIEYDQNPLVAVTDVFQWGFKGINFHWGGMRQYTWDEIAGNIYEVYAAEIKDLESLPFAKIRLNT